MKNRIKNTSLKGKTVLITGASGGLGFEMAKILIEDYGANVLGICRNEKKMKKSLERLKENKKYFSYKLFDVRDKEKWLNLKEELDKNNTVIDTLILNAGFMHPFLKLEDLKDEEIDEIIDTNLKANITAFKTLLPNLKKSSNPKVAFVISSAALSAVVGESLYCTTKFALRGLIDTLRAEYKNKIKFTGIYPGFVKTDILNRQKFETKNNKLINNFMAPANKIAYKSVKAIIKGKKSIVTGFDGKLMAFFGKFFPYFTADATAFVLKSSKQELFKDIFKE